MSQRILQQNNYRVIVDIIPTNYPNTHHVNVRVHPQDRQNIRGQAGIQAVLAQIALNEARTINPNAQLVIPQWDMDLEYQGQFQT